MGRSVAATEFWQVWMQSVFAALNLHLMQFPAPRRPSPGPEAETPWHDWLPNCRLCRGSGPIASKYYSRRARAPGRCYSPALQRFGPNVYSRWLFRSREFHGGEPVLLTRLLTYQPSSAPDTCPALERPSAYEALSAGPSRSAAAKHPQAHSYLRRHRATAVAPIAAPWC